MTLKRIRRIHLSRPLAFLDLETTGRWPERDRIVEIGVLKLRPEGSTQEFRSHVNPECRIPREATAIHGIRNSQVQDAPTFRELAPKLLGLLAHCDLCGFNISRFDLPCLTAEFRRAGVPFDLHGRSVIDVQAIFHGKEPRDLGAALRFYCGKQHLRAHSALADARACLGILQAQVRRYRDLPCAVEGLAEFSASRDIAFLDSGRWFEPRDELPWFARGKHWGKALGEVARGEPDYLRWLLGEQGVPEDTKRLVKQALDRVMKR